MEADRAWLLTPSGVGAIAVIRFRGAGIGSFFARRFSKSLQAHRCVHGELSDAAGAVIDDPVIVLMDEFTADVNVHGGDAVVRAVLGVAEREGFLLEAPPIDDTAADVVERETHAALPLARTRLGVSTLLEQPSAWRSVAWTPQAAQVTLADRSLCWLLNPPTVAIIGQANVGKSTLANHLFGRARSIVFDQPGTTRDYVSDLADFNGLPVHLIDTPGQRMTDDAIEASAIETSRILIARADLRLLVLDGSTAIDPQQNLLDQYRSDVSTLIVISKSDRPAAGGIDVAGALHVSAATGQGMAKLVADVRSRFATSDTRGVPRWWTPRQRLFLERLAATTA